MNALPHILIYGSAANLIDTRRMVLERSGFRVTVSLDLGEIDKLLTAECFDLFLLCHTLARWDCDSALLKAQALRPTMTNLVLGVVPPRWEGAAHVKQMTAFVAPASLLAMVKEVIKITEPESTHGASSG